ncbi:hypothetical protein CA54_41170 [Symmachiella macrocystis]|uniref:Plasmid related protein n=1 Tax=Symmachiella macrocystis TaxID=2527985 RepID=A0A5C6BA82_9PLAN|nr:hypothetical protein [Symmachiella macrocystis]TWU08878.1 hypothetical protein CA54_41170 [Symmachiella macrocystis]
MSNSNTFSGVPILKNNQPRFPLGQCAATPGAIDAVAETGEDLGSFVRRHHGGEWGDVCEEDAQANDDALTDGSRLLSVYFTKNYTKLYVITEADRSVTTVLLADEY